MKYFTVTLVEAVGDRTVERTLRIEAGSQLLAELRASDHHPDANIERVEGPHE